MTTKGVAVEYLALVYGDPAGWEALSEAEQAAAYQGYVAVSEEAIRTRLLTRPAEADAIAEAADGLYQEAVMLPLLRRAQNSSPPTPTDDSTSAPKDSAPTPLKRSKRSSTTTSPMDGTAQISA